MLFDYLLDNLPIVLAFATPTMPSVGLPQSPTASADAEKQRQAAADRVQRDATLGGRSSTIVGGNDVAYKKQARQAGADLMGSGSSRDMGL
jgi:hypothetical protein